MKKLLLIGAMLCALCTIGYGSTKMSSVPADVHEGHEWVDLGLPSGLKWATCNVGAANPGDYGDYYSWGMTTAKKEGVYGYSKLKSDIGGNLSCDAAAASWGGNWRMPTNSELQELLDYCTWTWTTMDGNNGYMVTGPNGESIFLPAAGFYVAEPTFPGDIVSYWSSTPLEGDVNTAYRMYCRFRQNDLKAVNGCKRSHGSSVRPVLAD